MVNFTKLTIKKGLHILRNKQASVFKSPMFEKSPRTDFLLAVQCHGFDDNDGPSLQMSHIMLSPRMTFSMLAKS